MQIDSDVPIPTHPALTTRAGEPFPETHSIKQAMTLLNCGHTTVYKLANEGEITLIKVFGKSLVLGLRDFIERKAAEARQLRPAIATANVQPKLVSAHEASQQPVTA